MKNRIKRWFLPLPEMPAPTAEYFGPEEDWEDPLLRRQVDAAINIASKSPDPNPRLHLPCARINPNQ